MNTHQQGHQEILEQIARRAMLERGLLPDFSPQVISELGRIHGPAPLGGPQVRDLRSLLWASIDNDDSLDLDQLTVAQALSDRQVKVLVAVSDVDALVKKGSAIDEHAGRNTTSVYTAARIFPMLPEELSTNLTSLSFKADRMATVVEMTVSAEGIVQASDIYQAFVHNFAKLAYHSVGAWLEGSGEMPEAVRQVSGLAENLKLQDQTAQRMLNYRHLHGALSLETLEARPVFSGDKIQALAVEQTNRAKDIIENFMIAANSVTAQYLTSRKFPSIRRVVREPKRWDRIIEIAAEHGVKLPEQPDSKALEAFLTAQRSADPLRFPDLSLAVVKCIGSGEYVADLPGDTPPGHFGLAVKDYTHSTAPNRRFTDLVTQRLLKSALTHQPAPYSANELVTLADHCTQEEDAVNKVERQVGKSAAALLLQSRIGEQFDALVTGAASKGTWVRLLSIPVEGKLVQGEEGLDVGDRARVQLISVDVENGFIDFKRLPFQDSPPHPRARAR